MTRNRWIFLPRPLVALVGSLLAACLGDAVEPVRDLRVVLESPHGAEGAAVMEVVGVGVSDVAGPAGTYTHVSGDTTRVVILLEEPGAIEFTMRVSGRAYPGVAVLQVVDEQDNGRDLAGYRARITDGASPP